MIKRFGQAILENCWYDRKTHNSAFWFPKT